MLLTIIDLLGRVCLVPLGFSILLLLLFIAYCILFAWLAIILFFSGHFRFMCNVWYLGLEIIINKKVWILAGIGILLIYISSVFS